MIRAALAAQMKSFLGRDEKKSIAIGAIAKGINACPAFNANPIGTMQIEIYKVK